MPTSHRAPRRSGGGPLRLLLIALVVLVVVAGGTYVARGVLTSSPDHASGGGTSGPTGSGSGSGSDSSTGSSTGPPSSPSASASGSASPSSPPSVRPTKKATKKATPAIAGVPVSPPHLITIGSAIVDRPFGSALSPTSGRLIPASPGTLQRLVSRGTPGSPGTDTTVIVGASSTSGRGALDGIDAVRTGADIVLETQTGRLTYTVSGVEDVAPNAVLLMPELIARVPGRLVIDCAHYNDARRIGLDRVLVARLTAASGLRP